MTIHSNYPLKDLNTFGMDVNARYYCEIYNFEDLIGICRNDVFVQNERLILGGGSNILFTKDFPGLVVNMQNKDIKILEEDDESISIKASAGENWNSFVLFCCENGWNGLENLAHIPGKVGASPVQNIGAYGVEVKDCISYVEAFNINTFEMELFSNEDCHFAYRNSYFKQEGKGKYIINSVTFKLSKQAKFNTSYGAIGEELEHMDVSEINAKSIAEAVMNIRKKKLPEPSEIGSAGSFFKNPVIGLAEYEKLKNLYPNIVAFPNKDDVKIGAGWLIEQCGWKGFRRGDVGVYEHQALILVNYGKASPQDVLLLSDEIIQSVKDKFGIQLEPEVNVI